MKVIFLDFDGVINSQTWMIARKDSVEQFTIYEQYPFYEIDPEAVKLLNHIIKETGAMVVVSSTWRNGRSIEELKTILEKVGFVGTIIDKTPSFGPPMQYGEESERLHYRTPRGCEIDAWLSSKSFRRINWSSERFLQRLERSEVKNYVILDDDSDMLYKQREHFVQTTWQNGLTVELAEKAIEILNTPIEKLYY